MLGIIRSKQVMQDLQVTQRGHSCFFSDSCIVSCWSAFLLGVFILSFGFSDPSKAMQVDGAFFDEKKKDNPPVELTDLSLLEAQKLFAEFKKDPNISFPLPEACFAKAQAMTRLAEQKKIVMGKVFAEVESDPLNEVDDGGLFVKPRTKGPQFISWQYHVAAMASVKSNEGGKTSTQVMVFDPYLFEGPVDLAKWKEALQYKGYKSCSEGKLICSEGSPLPECRKASPCRPMTPAGMNIYMGNRFQYKPLSHVKEEVSPYREAYLSSDLENMKQIFNVFKRAPSGTINLGQLYEKIRSDEQGGVSNPSIVNDADEDLSENSQTGR